MLSSPQIVQHLMAASSVINKFKNFGRKQLLSNFKHNHVSKNSGKPIVSKDVGKPGSPHIVTSGTRPYPRTS
jgi:hypothetical protein